MSERGRGGDKSDVGEPPTAPVRSISTAEASAAGTEAATVRFSSLSIVDKTRGPLTPTTPSTLDAVTTGTESEQSSDRGRDERTSSPEHPRQVIAVSVAKGPAAFFNLARKFLVTDEECDLSALEGAIVSAVDAAHLLERSKIATIIQIQTSYPTVEPKKRREQGPTSSISEEASGTQHTETGATSATTGTSTRQPQAIGSSLAVAAGPGPSSIDQPGSSTIDSSTSASPVKPKSSVGTMRRARIVITVRRTAAYKKWLEDNPIQDTHTGQDEDHI
mmetsp:Transcript_15015/g.36054  ORF Transcript_15015/g.36054 Transcript_15015/m.36054 type:complete len:276 (+) Transcript_15015:288-1115(+)